MNRSRDQWTEPGRDDVLSRAMHDAAERVDAGLPDDHLYASAFARVRDRARRRRAAKVGGLGAASLAMVGVLAVGAAQLGGLLRTEPVVPGGSPSVTVVEPAPSAPTTPAPTTTSSPTESASDPASPAPEVPAGDCSGASLAGEAADFSGLPEGARRTAELLLDAATRCDEQLLYTAATESATNLSFGDQTPDEVFALPEDEDQAYGTLARLLARTEGAYDEASGLYVWPRLQLAANLGSDEAWREVVDAGILTQELADTMRGSGEYHGYRVGIAEDGTWQYFVAGD
ncbi:hypothetical protein L1785_01130 [Antribacter sp. KLBMP9083]|uniref:Uncharacterized protein n=1 Tax=Antribacter soli TaxID=2910976 RepID=A0AA41U5T5_9MICO|nr:hypothetical protein [Antribacter soli]MCF4119580.1 hypothetical protein [Antribacter soli]